MAYLWSLDFTLGAIALLHDVCVCVRLSGVFSGAESSHLAEFLKAAGLLREQFRFAHITDPQIAKEHNAKSESEWVNGQASQHSVQHFFFCCFIVFFYSFSTVFGIKTDLSDFFVC